MTAQSARSRSAIAGPHPARISLLAQSSTETFWCWTHRSELQRLWPCLDVRHFVPNKVHRHRRIGPSGPSRRSRAVHLPSRVAQRSVWRGSCTSGDLMLLKLELEAIPELCRWHHHCITLDCSKAQSSLAYTARAAPLRADSQPRACHSAIPQPSSAPATRSSATSCVALSGAMSRFSRSTPPIPLLKYPAQLVRIFQSWTSPQNGKVLVLATQKIVRSNGRPFGGGDLQEACWRMAQAAVAPGMNRASGVAACRGFDDGIVSGGGGGVLGERREEEEEGQSCKFSLSAASISAHIYYK